MITDHNSFLFCSILSEKCKNVIHSVKNGGKLNYFLRKVAFMILWKVGESVSECLYTSAFQHLFFCWK